MIPFTTTSEDPAVRVKVVNGTRDAFEMARPLAGSVADATEIPAPAGVTTTPVAHDAPVVGLKPAAEVHPAGKVLAGSATHAKPVVEL